MVFTVLYIAQLVLEILFVSSVTTQLNEIKIPGDKDYRNPTTTTLLCLFVPFYVCFWIYKMAQRIDVILKERGSQETVTTLYLVLGIFITVVALILMYLKLKDLNIVTIGNGSTTTYNNPNYQNTNTNSYTNTGYTNVTPAPVNDNLVSAADALMKYKELLDLGILTQEEFDAKKKELLNL